MKQHGGAIAVESDLGIGTTVTLRFPRKEEAC
jgi:signal transduction histidine kinase